MINTKFNSDDAKAGCGYAIAILALSPFFAVWKGYAISVLWRWFIVTSFGLPALSIPAAIGISYVVTLISHVPPMRPKESADALEQFFWTLSVGTLAPALGLGFGYVVHLWM